MTYDALVKKVAAQAGVKPNVVKDVLFAVPDALVRLAAAEDVRTPMGVFTMTIRGERKVRKIGAEGFNTIKAERVVKLKPGSRLRSPA